MPRVRAVQKSLSECQYCGSACAPTQAYCSNECRKDDRYSPAFPTAEATSGTRPVAQLHMHPTPVMVHAVDVAKHMNAPELDVDDDAPTVRIPRNWLGTLRGKSVI